MSRLSFVERFKNLFRPYKVGYEYEVDPRDIKVPADFACTRIGEQKWQRKLAYYHETGKLQSDIIINTDFVLVDGYSSLKIALLNNVKSVAVTFVA